MCWCVGRGVWHSQGAGTCAHLELLLGCGVAALPVTPPQHVAVCVLLLCCFELPMPVRACSAAACLQAGRAMRQCNAAPHTTTLCAHCSPNAR
jgi:hypothetical protein